MLTFYMAMCIIIEFYPSSLTLHTSCIYSVNVVILAFNKITLANLHAIVYKDKLEPLTFNKMLLCKFTWGGLFLQNIVSFYIPMLVFTAFDSYNFRLWLNIIGSSCYVYLPTYTCYTYSLQIKAYTCYHIDMHVECSYLC